MAPARQLASAFALSSLAAASIILVTGPAAAEEPESAPAPCDAAAEACVDLTTEQAWLMEDGEVTYGPVPMRGGMPGYETPIGTFKVLWKDIDHRSREYNNAPMPYSVFFTETGVAFHEGDLSRQSHGCVRLSHSAAQKFYEELQEGEVVQVVATAPPPADPPADPAPPPGPPADWGDDEDEHQIEHLILERADQVLKGLNAPRLGPAGP